MSEAKDIIRAKFKGRCTEENKEALASEMANECARLLATTMFATGIDNFIRAEFEIEGEYYILDFRKKQIKRK